MLTFGGWDAILTKSVGDTDKKSTDKTLMWGLSSAGRASALQAEGHRFEPYRPHIPKDMLKRCADVAQLAEQLICNQQVIGSSPIIGFMEYNSIWMDSRVAKGDRL